MGYRQFLVSVFCVLTLAGCAPSYEADLDLRQNWTPELEKSGHLGHVPYAVSFQGTEKHLVYGALGHGDSDFAQRLTAGLQPDAQVRGFEDNPAVSFESLVQAGYTPKDALCYAVIDRLNQSRLKQLKSEQTLFRIATKTIQELKTDHGMFAGEPCDVKVLKAWFKEKAGKPLSVKVLKDGLLVAPMKDGTYLQKMAEVASLAQDIFFYEQVRHVLNQDTVKTLLVLRPASHFVQERKVFEDMMGAPARVLPSTRFAEPLILVESVRSE